MTDTCEVLGRMSNTEIKYIDSNDRDKGIKITYNKGIIYFEKAISVQIQKYLHKTDILEKSISIFYVILNKMKILFKLKLMDIQ